MSSKNRVLNNFFNSANGDAPNGTDIAWDGLGEGTCFEENWRGEDVPATTDAAFLPPCNIPVNGQPMPTTAAVPTASNLLAQASLVIVEGEPICFRMGTCEMGLGTRARERAQPPGGISASSRPHSVRAQHLSLGFRSTR
jgi:hypothetical protein